MRRSARRRLSNSRSSASFCRSATSTNSKISSIRSTNSLSDSAISVAWTTAWWIADVSAGRKSAGFTHGFGRGGSGRRSGRTGWGLTGRTGSPATGSGGAFSEAATGDEVSGAVEMPTSFSAAGKFSAAGSGAVEISPAVGGAASPAGRGPRSRPRPPRRPRRRVLGRRAEGGRFRLDCSSGTNFLSGRMAACPANAKTNYRYFLTNKARAAVWLCRKFFSPMGPISPLQKNPARPSGPK